MKGHFACKKSSRKFSDIHEDQAHEQNNKLVKIEGGAIRILDNHISFMKWLIGGPEILRVLRSFEDEEQKDRKILSHHEATASHEKLYRKHRIDIVFNRYFEDGLESDTREKRSSGTRISVKPSTPIYKIWQQFLRVSENREALVHLLARQLGKCSVPAKVIVATASQNIESSSSINKESLCPSNQEDADTRIFLHAKHAANAGNRFISIRTVDTDMVVIAESLFRRLNVEELWIEFGIAQKLLSFLSQPLGDRTAHTIWNEIQALARLPEIDPTTQQHRRVDLMRKLWHQVYPPAVRAALPDSDILSMPDLVVTADKLINATKASQHSPESADAILSRFRDLRDTDPTRDDVDYARVCAAAKQTTGDIRRTVPGHYGQDRRVRPAAGRRPGDDGFRRRSSTRGSRSLRLNFGDSDDEEDRPPSKLPAAPQIRALPAVPSASPKAFAAPTSPLFTPSRSVSSASPKASAAPTSPLLTLSRSASTNQ
ncbi:hypothetical protein GQR58_006141 [Nymphon striatum]|nr:hypothetical protein GQR58_006141 [Nymphon striatum]